LTAPTNRSFSERALASSLSEGLAAKDVSACRYALDLGADPNATFGTAGSYLTFAIEHGFTEGAILLLDRGSHVEATGVNRRSPLLSAARMGNVLMCAELLDRGAHISGRSTATVWPVEVGVTALHEAARKSRVDAGKYLIERGADQRALDDSGHTPLHSAVTGDGAQRLEFTKMLLAGGANPDFTPADAPITYLTPFQWALTIQSTEAAQYLLEEYAHLARSPTLAGKDVIAIASASNRTLVLQHRARLLGEEISAAVAEAGIGSPRQTISRAPDPL
jgi:ankyrin repeat protein